MKKKIFHFTQKIYVSFNFIQFPKITYLVIDKYNIIYSDILKNFSTVDSQNIDNKYKTKILLNEYFQWFYKIWRKLNLHIQLLEKTFFLLKKLQKLEPCWTKTSSSSFCWIQTINFFKHNFSFFVKNNLCNSLSSFNYYNGFMLLFIIKIKTAAYIYIPQKSESMTSPSQLTKYFFRK